MVIGGAILAGTYATLGLWLSVSIETVSLIGWTILLYRSLEPDDDDPYEPGV